MMTNTKTSRLAMDIENLYGENDPARDYILAKYDEAIEAIRTEAREVEKAAGYKFDALAVLLGEPEATSPADELHEKAAALQARAREIRKGFVAVKGSDACPRCNGNGIIPGYKHVSNGICFKCGGSGKAK